MSLASNSSSRRYDVLQARIAELEAQEQTLAERSEWVRKIDHLDPLQRVTGLKSQSRLDRLQPTFSAAPGEEVREALLEKIPWLPTTSHGIATTPFKTKIGIISDLFLYKSFQGLADFYPVYPHNYEQLGHVDILLLVSTWRGIDGVSWHGVTSKKNELRARLFEDILPFYRSRGIPIVFYSKEDPPNYNAFVDFAKQADHIFTSAEEVIPKYEQDCPDARSIGLLPFGINPKNHSPIGSQAANIEKTIPFAGSWFNHKYPARRRWGSEILDAVMASKNYDLAVFNRNSDIKNNKYKFPNRYAPAITPAIEHQDLLDLQRVTDFGINLNSVDNSSTMFANRAIELQAQGTFVLSNYNVGLNSRYPHIHITNGFADTVGSLDQLTEPQIREVQAAGIRAVFSNDLAIMRIAKIIETVGLSAHVADPRVAIMTHGSDERLLADIARQSYTNVVDVIQASTGTTVDHLQDRADIVVHLDPNFEYAATHVEDLANAFRYTDARVVEKLERNATGQPNFRRHWYSEPVNWHSLGAEFIGETPEGIDVKCGYHIDEIGVKRRNAATELSSQRSKPAILSVVIPIYNNGAHLLHKCISSLRRSSIFDQMEIVLVDDGSTDTETIEVIGQLERELGWVIVHRFEPGGSGSASRPRNKGLELATCDYITYLDPDNEALNDAYVKLLHRLIETGVDFVVGDMTRWRGKNSPVRYTNFLKKGLEFEGNIARGGRQALIDMKFMPMSIQALVARTQWLRETGITQPEGAVGQDSYFFQQMLYYADRFAIRKVTAHTYYSQVENSVVNTVNASLFEKYLPLERARSEWLAELGLLEEYKQTRLEPFFVGWYLRKLPDVPESQRAKAIETITELGQMYGEHDWQSEEANDFWAATSDKLMQLGGNK